MGIKYRDVVRFPVVSGRDHLLKTFRGKPSVDFLLIYRHDFEGWLGSRNGKVIPILHYSFYPDNSRNESVLKLQPFQVLNRGCLPKVEPFFVRAICYEIEVNARIQSEDSPFRYLEDSTAPGIKANVMFLTSLSETRQG